MGNGYIVPSPGEAGGDGAVLARWSQHTEAQGKGSRAWTLCGAQLSPLPGDGGSAPLWGLLMETLHRDGNSSAGSRGTVPPHSPGGDGWVMDGQSGAGSRMDASAR